MCQRRKVGPKLYASKRILNFNIRTHVLILNIYFRESKHQIVVGNIHMYWNPREEDVKYF